MGFLVHGSVARPRLLGWDSAWVACLRHSHLHCSALALHASALMIGLIEDGCVCIQVPLQYRYAAYMHDAASRTGPSAFARCSMQTMKITRWARNEPPWFSPFSYIV